MSLNGTQLEELHTVMLQAYDEASLEQMLRFRLDIDIWTVVERANFSNVVFQLISWAEREGRTQELIAEASAHVPKSEELKSFAAKYAETISGQENPILANGEPTDAPAEGEAAKPAWRRADGLWLLLSLLAPIGALNWWVLYVAGLNAARLGEPRIFYLLAGELTIATSGYVLLWSFLLYPKRLSR